MAVPSASPSRMEPIASSEVPRIPPRGDKPWPAFDPAIPAHYHGATPAWPRAGPVPPVPMHLGRLAPTPFLSWAVVLAVTCFLAWSARRDALVHLVQV